MNSRMAMAEKLSVPQLQQAIQSGSLPAYIGVPLIEQKTREQAQMAAASQGQQEAPPSVTQQILQQAEQQQQADSGIDQLPSNLPVEGAPQGMAGGGIVAFAEGGAPEDRRSPADRAMDEVIARIMSRQAANSGAPTPQSDSESLYGTVDPLAEGPSPAAQEPNFVGGQTGGGAFVGYRRQKGAGSGTPRGRTAPLPLQDLSALDFDAPSLTAPQLANPALAEVEDPRLASAPVGIPTPKTGTGAAGAGTGAPTTGTGARTTAQTAGQAPMGQAPGQPAQQSALDKYAEMLMAERGEDAKERQQAKGMALLQAGLGIAGGTSPNALANIAQGALPATQSYQAALRDIKKSDRDRLKQLMELGVTKEKLAIEARKLGIEDKKVEGLLARYAAMGAGGGSESKFADQVNRTFSTLLGAKAKEMGVSIDGLSEEEILKLQNTAINLVNRAYGRTSTEPTQSSAPTTPSGITVRRIS